MRLVKLKKLFHILSILLIVTPIYAYSHLDEKIFFAKKYIKHLRDSFILECLEKNLSLKKTALIVLEKLEPIERAVELFISSSESELPNCPFDQEPPISHYVRKYANQVFGEALRKYLTEHQMNQFGQSALDIDRP